MSFHRRVSPLVRAVRAAATAGVFILSGWLAGLLWFVELIPQHVKDSQTPTDAIVVLTGGSGRLDVGLSLLEQGVSDKLFVSGVYQGVDVAKLLQVVQRKPQDLDCCISIGHAEDTIGNALETRDWMRQNGYESLRFVTSAYHMPRALLEFVHVMPDVRIVLHPVFTQNVKHVEWWKWPGTTRLIVSEYHKFIGARLRIIFSKILRGDSA